MGHAVLWAQFGLLETTLCAQFLAWYGLGLLEDGGVQRVGVTCLEVSRGLDCGLFLGCGGMLMGDGGMLGLAFVANE